MTEPSHIQHWNKVKNHKSQRQIWAELEAIFGAKEINRYEEDGKIIRVYEAR